MTFALFTLFVALCAYVLLGGADFGAGLYELLTGDKGRVDKALSPVWEANHVWLILIIVLLFNVFPVAYAQAVTLLHIPLGLALFGIVARGTAFTFRHYDTRADTPRSFDFMFRMSSILTPVALGAALAATANGRLTTNGTFFDCYVAPWLSLHALSVGTFFAMLCMHVATVFLCVETSGDRELMKLARRVHLVVVLAGIGTMASAYAESVPWLANTTRGIVVLALIGASAATLIVFSSIHRKKPMLLLVSTGAEVFFVLLAYLAARWPIVAMIDDVQHVASIDSDIDVSLTLALAAGLTVVLPSLALLFIIFKRDESSA